MNKSKIFPLVCIRSAAVSAACLLPDVRPFREAELKWLAGMQKQESLKQDLQKAFDDALSACPDVPMRTRLYNARKFFFQKHKIQEAFLKEAHAFPELKSAIEAWYEALQEQALLQKALDEAFELLTQNAQALLVQFAGNENFRQSLLYASHDFLRRLIQNTSKKDARYWLSLYQYAVRAALKTSPFSRMGTVDLWRLLGHEPDEAVTFGKKLVVANVALLPRIYEVLLLHPDFYETLSLQCASSLRLSGEGWAWLYFDGVREAFQQLPSRDYLNKIAGIFKAQAQIPFLKLMSLLDEDFEPDAGRNLILQLCEMGFLEWVWPEKGLSPGWTTALYQYLGHHCRASAPISEAAFLLQHLRTCAKTLPFLALEEALTAQRTALEQVNAWLDKNGFPPVDIPAEHLFYEDVCNPAEQKIPEKALHQALNEIETQLGAAAPFALAPLRSGIQAFAEKNLGPKERMNFLDFAQCYLGDRENKEQSDKKLRFPPKTGALIQFFRRDDNWFCVVNGLYPGGGKMLARWMPLFSPFAKDELVRWNSGSGAAFPWQSWTNVVFQPGLPGIGVRVQDDRVPNATLDLCALNVGFDANGLLALYYKSEEEAIQFIDLGLESPDNKPPVMQILYALGVAQCSLGDLNLAEAPWSVIEPGLSERPRLVTESIVWRRKSWRLSQNLEGMPSQKQSLVNWGLQLRQKWVKLGIPLRFFVREPGSKPQYIDLYHPVALMAFQKMLSSAEKRELILTEVLPDWEKGDAVLEFAVEVV